MRHGAVIKLDLNLIAKMLDFEGGIVHRVYMPEPYITPDHCCVVLEHPDLPAVPDNGRLPEVQPVMRGYYADDGSLLRVERIDPPKKSFLQILATE